MVKLVISKNFKERGKGYWKLNTQLLRDSGYVEKMNNLIDIQLEQKKYYKDIRDHWEVMKIDIAGSSIQYAARKKKAENNELAALEKKLKFWENERDESGYFNNQERHILNLRRDIK